MMGWVLALFLDLDFHLFIPNDHKILLLHQWKTTKTYLIQIWRLCLQLGAESRAQTMCLWFHPEIQNFNSNINFCFKLTNFHTEDHQRWWELGLRVRARDQTAGLVHSVHSAGLDQFRSDPRACHVRLWWWLKKVILFCRTSIYSMQSTTTQTFI